MNSQKILEVFLDGAYHQDGKLFHSSFKKGFRTIKFSNIALISAESKLRKLGKLISSDGITKAV